MIGATASATKINGIYYSFNKNAKTAEVTYQYYIYDHYHSNENAYSGDAIIPSNVIYEGESYTVTTIGDDAFRLCHGLTSVTIPNTITYIGENAFEYCDGLNAVYISDLNAWLNIGYPSSL